MPRGKGISAIIRLTDERELVIRARDFDRSSVPGERGAKHHRRYPFRLCETSYSTPSRRCAAAYRIHAMYVARSVGERASESARVKADENALAVNNGSVGFPKARIRAYDQIKST